MVRHFPQGIFDWVNKVATRHRGQKLGRVDLARQYDQATTRILATLASVDDDDFEKSATYPDWDPLLSGEVTLNAALSLRQGALRVARTRDPRRGRGDRRAIASGFRPRAAGHPSRRDQPPGAVPSPDDPFRPPQVAR
jgi:hypothetical protein